MICKEEVCMWFKDNEPHRRLELICGLLNMCVPLELRFIRTCVEDLGKRDDVLREVNSNNKTNNSDELTSQLSKLDERTRRKLLIVYIALLEADNQTCSKVLFKSLSQIIQTTQELLSSEISREYVKEMLLIYTMVIYHPAFSFEEKRIVGDDLQSLQEIEKQTFPNDLWYKSREEIVQPKPEQYGSLSANSCHSDALITLDHSQIMEQNCDSGLSIGTEPEGELLSDHPYFPDQQLVEANRGIPSSESSSNPDLNLDSNVLNVGPNFFCAQNDSCHFYPFMGNISSLPVAARRGTVPTAPSETSSSEDNGVALQSNCLRQRTDSRAVCAGGSSQSSPQSSPYASPPQSLSPSRAASPKVNGTTTTIAPSSLSSSHHSRGLVSGTTTALVVSQSNPKPAVRLNNNSGINSSHSSSPNASNMHVYRSKPLINKNQKSNERINPRQRGLSHSTSQPNTYNLSLKQHGKDIAASSSNSVASKANKNISSDANCLKVDKSRENPSQPMSSETLNELTPSSESSNIAPSSPSNEQMKKGPPNSSSNNLHQMQDHKKDSFEAASSGNYLKNGLVSTTSTPLYTTTISTTAVVPAMLSPGNYQPYFSFPMMSIGAATPYYPSGSPYPHTLNPGRPHHQSFVLANPGLLQGVPPGTLVKGGPHSLRNPSHFVRGGSSNGRSSSSSSNCSIGSSHGMGGRKKNSSKGSAGPNQKSRSSSDSSPSSSQYSSPPQTPSPDHMKDLRPKNNKLESETPEDAWTDPLDTNGSNSAVVLDDSHSLVNPHLMMPSNIRQRCMPYSPMGFVGYPHPQLMRYPLGGSPVLVGPRGPLPPFNSGEKSSREATPPNSIQPNPCPPPPPPPVPQDAMKKDILPPPPLSMPPPATSACASMPPLSTTQSKVKGILLSSSSSSPPISSPLLNSPAPQLPPTHLPPPPVPPQALPANANVNSTVQYNPNYPMFAVTGAGGGSSPFLAHLSTFMHASPNSNLTNSFVSPHHPLAPNFPLSNGGGGGMTSELLYPPSQFPVLGPSSQPPGGSSGGSHQSVIPPQNGPPPGLQIAPGIPFSPPYPSSQGGLIPHTQPPPVPPPPKRPFTCYNCGQVGHRGTECKEASINDLTKR